MFEKIKINKILYQESFGIIIQNFKLQNMSTEFAEIRVELAYLYHIVSKHAKSCLIIHSHNILKMVCFEAQTKFSFQL